MSRSVEPIEVWLSSNGPPLVMRKIRVKLLKLKANEASSSGPTATSSSGMMIERIIRNPVAPSMLAASLTSPGIDCSAPVQTMNM